MCLPASLSLLSLGCITSGGLSFTKAELSCQLLALLASIAVNTGNFFFAGARLFFRSLEAAIFLFSRVARIPEGSLVLPAICTEERITLGAEMANGTIIRGQNEISHPSAPGQLPPGMTHSSLCVRHAVWDRCNMHSSARAEAACVVHHRVPGPYKSGQAWAGPPAGGAYPAHLLPERGGNHAGA
jgi:hypothetical protein